MKKLFIATLLVLVPLGFFSIHPVHATTLAALSDEDLIDKSGAIVHGTIIQKESIQYDARTILTKVTLRVEEYLKKPEGSTEDSEFVFYTRGGVIGDVVQTVAGEFRAVEGAEVIVFLEKIKKYGDLWMVLGLRTGAYWVEKADEADAHAEKMVLERSPIACGPVKPQKVALREVRERIIRRVAKSRPGAMK
ncbi:MAG: hypothetical protein J6A01_12660 [Proteobacteria bacterium]|nr:hypothetical protein [Pseudomonadota bacterium]